MYYSLFKQTKIYLNSWKYSKSPENWIEGKIISFKKKNFIFDFSKLWLICLHQFQCPKLNLTVNWQKHRATGCGAKVSKLFLGKFGVSKLNLTVNRQKLVLFWNETERETGDCFKYQSRMPDNQGRLLGRGLIFMTFSS